MCFDEWATFSNQINLATTNNWTRIGVVWCVILKMNVKLFETKKIKITQTDAKHNRQCVRIGDMIQKLRAKWKKEPATTPKTEMAKYQKLLKFRCHIIYFGFLRCEHFLFVHFFSISICVHAFRIDSVQCCVCALKWKHKNKENKIERTILASGESNYMCL